MSNMRGVRRPVSIVTAVQRTFGAVNSDVHIRIAAHSEDHLFATRLMNWSVADDPRIALQQLFVLFGVFPPGVASRPLLRLQRKT